MLQANNIKPARGSKHRVKRVGRGNASGHGTYSTRGGKGQTARSGGSRGLIKLGFRRLMQSTPKLRGFKSHRDRPAEIYLSELTVHFADGETITLESLREKNLIGNTVKAAKVLATGEVSKKFILSGLLATKSAAEQIVKAGGEIK